MTRERFMQLTPAQQADWFAKQAVDALNEMARKAREKTKAPDETA